MLTTADSPIVTGSLDAGAAALGADALAAAGADDGTEEGTGAGLGAGVATG